MTDKEKFIVLVDSDMLVPADAIILLEGDGFARIRKCAELFHAKYAPLICFSGGVKNLDYGSLPFEFFEDKLPQFNLTPADFIIENRSQHTREQAIEVVKLTHAYGWKRIILVASNFHQYRAYLTFLKVLEETRSTTLIMNAPASNLPWFEAEHWGQRFNLLSNEFEKIEKYIETGHCVTYEKAINYQREKERWILEYLKKS